MRVPFQQVLEYLEEHGWGLIKTWGTRRVFLNRERPQEPIIVRVKDRSVDHEDFQRIRRIIEEESGSA